ncbi:hypothetical protein EDD15DRAFT_143365 [Pisolithus albus]|nr:hypothetical protein EDD15DRAFT_143365 [Pisolithus albus]
MFAPSASVLTCFPKTRYWRMLIFIAPMTARAPFTTRVPIRKSPLTASFWHLPHAMIQVLIHTSWCRVICEPANYLMHCDLRGPEHHRQVMVFVVAGVNTLGDECGGLDLQNAVVCSPYIEFQFRDTYILKLLTLGHVHQSHPWGFSALTISMHTCMMSVHPQSYPTSADCCSAKIMVSGSSTKNEIPWSHEVGLCLLLTAGQRSDPGVHT